MCSCVCVLMLVCVCVCVCMCERERERERAMCTYTPLHRIQKRLGELSDHIAEINREETLFQWSQSTYPQLDAIGNTHSHFRTS